MLLSAICVQKPLLEFQKAKLELEAELVKAAAARESQKVSFFPSFFNFFLCDKRKKKTHISLPSLFLPFSLFPSLPPALSSTNKKQAK